MDIQARRRRRAWSVTVGCIAVLGISCVLSAPGPAMGASGAVKGGLAESVMAYAQQEEPASVDDLVDRAVGRVGGGQTEGTDGLPAWFSAEVFETGFADRVYVFGGGAVVGLITSEGREEVRDRLIDELLAKGWLLAECGDGSSVTGTKEGGEASWLSLSCTPVSNATCVVVQVPSRP